MTVSKDPDQVGTDMAGGQRVTNIPDGGYGWVVVFAGFMLQTLTKGITYTFGVLFVDLLDFYQAGASTTAWVGSIQAALLNFTGEHYFHVSQLNSGFHIWASVGTPFLNDSH